VTCEKHLGQQCECEGSAYDKVILHLATENKRLREALDSVLAGEHTDRQLRNIARAALRGEGEK
jgi:hypothetical protein